MLPLLSVWNLKSSLCSLRPHPTQPRHLSSLTSPPALYSSPWPPGCSSKSPGSGPPKGLPTCRFLSMGLPHPIFQERHLRSSQMSPPAKGPLVTTPQGQSPASSKGRCREGRVVPPLSTCSDAAETRLWTLGTNYACLLPPALNVHCSSLWPLLTHRLERTAPSHRSPHGDPWALAAAITPSLQTTRLRLWVENWPVQGQGHWSEAEIWPNSRRGRPMSCRPPGIRLPGVRVAHAPSGVAGRCPLSALILQASSAWAPSEWQSSGVSPELKPLPSHPPLPFLTLFQLHPRHVRS